MRVDDLPFRPERVAGRGRPLGRLISDTAWSRRLDLAIIVSITLADQLAKAIVRSTIPLHASLPVIPEFFNLTHVRNTGAAFGFMNAASFPFKAALMTLVATLALIAIAVYSVFLPLGEKLTRVGLALILGGALGNLIDRAWVGYVTDFVDLYWRQYHFWAFNVADSAITIGAGLLILDILTQKTNVSKAA